jgi:hypothetical protein
VPVPVHDILVLGPVPDGLTKHSRDDTIGRTFEKLPSETAADAVAHIKELADAQMVHDISSILSKNQAVGMKTGFRGKTRGGQGGRGWVATNSGRYGMAGLPGTASLEPR